jgi:hypothetical protein
MAKAFNKYVAGKVNFHIHERNRWHAVNYDDKTVAGRDRSHYGYDGINVYGDEVSCLLAHLLYKY